MNRENKKWQGHKAPLKKDFPSLVFILSACFSIDGSSLEARQEPPQKLAQHMAATGAESPSKVKAEFGNYITGRISKLGF